MVELIWDGKYTADGKKVAPVRLALPFQDVETVNESAKTRNLMLDLFARNQPGEWRNRLIWGDKKYVLPSLLPEFAGKVNLIYIDPPFATGDDFSYTASIPGDPDTEGDQGATFVKAPSMIETKAYRDTWARGLDSYLQWFYETVFLLRELLADDGSIYVHLDWHVGDYAKAVLDEVFGIDNFVNEVVWRRAFAHNDPSRCGMIHDNILFYSRSEQRTWNRLFQKPSAEYINQFFDQYDTVRKERYARLPLDAPRHGTGGNLIYEWKGAWPAKNRTWAYTKDKMEEFDKAGRIHYPRKGMPRLKRYESEYEGTVLQDIWLDINKIHNQSSEQLHYPTQKPEALLERIIKASSNEGDLVLDCFAGSGTTAAVAEKLNRRWITADLGRFAIHTTRKRLLSIPDVRPFVVQNLGKYERQAWQVAEFGQDSEKAALAQARYRRFILDLYGAEPIQGYSWLHGLKAGKLVHVGSVDAPVLAGDIQEVAREFRQTHGAEIKTTGVDVLGWDFAFELNEIGKQFAADANLTLTFKRIPREVLEKKAVEQGDIHFFELAALDVNVVPQPRRTLCVELRDFIVSPDDVPEQVQKAITHWSQWIDYWAVDWDYKGDTFHNQWQSYRARKQPKLELHAQHTYESSGTYTVVIKVIDILGNDTTKSVRVEVR